MENIVNDVLTTIHVIIVVFIRACFYESVLVWIKEIYSAWVITNLEPPFAGTNVSKQQGNTEQPKTYIKL